MEGGDTRTRLRHIEFSGQNWQFVGGIYLFFGVRTSQNDIGTTLERFLGKKKI